MAVTDRVKRSDGVAATRAGASASRNGQKADRNPYSGVRTPAGRALAGLWLAGYREASK